MVRQSRSWTFSFFHGSTRLKLAILQNHTRSFKSLQSLANSAIKGRTTNCFILNDVGWVCEMGNVLKDYNFPGMLGKMHACVVSVYQALKKREPGYEAKDPLCCVAIIDFMLPPPPFFGTRERIAQYSKLHQSGHGQG